MKVLPPKGIALLSFLLAIVACERQGTKPEEAPLHPDELAGLVKWHRQIRLQENDSVINVMPHVNLDPAGGFLVADIKEGQIRRYGTDGKLLRAFGSKGAGPAEFKSPTAALRMSDGSILTLDAGAPKAALFDSTGSELIRTIRTPFHTIYDADLLDDSLLLVSGRILENGWERLHIWNVNSNTLVRSFFPAPVADEDRSAAMSVGFVTADVLRDTIVAVFALSDTLYFFTAAGAKLEQVRIPSQYFRHLDQPPPTGGSGGIAAVRDWLATFSTTAHVFWTSDTTLLVQYQDRENMLPRWRLLYMRRSGERIFELVDTPKLLASGMSRDSLYFVDPGSETPSLWIVGVLQ